MLKADHPYAGHVNEAPITGVHVRVLLVLCAFFLAFGVAMGWIIGQSPAVAPCERQHAPLVIDPRPLASVPGAPLGRGPK